jgi:hypothetical protein
MNRHLLIFKFSIFFLFILISSILVAQTKEIATKWAKEEPYPICPSEAEVLFEDDKKLLVYKPSAKYESDKLEILDRFTLASKKVIPFPPIVIKDLFAKPQQVISDGNQVLAFYIKITKGTVNQGYSSWPAKIFGVSINANDGKSTKEPLLLMETTSCLDMMKDVNDYSSKVSVLVLPSANKKLIGILVKIENKENQVKYEYKVFDYALKEISSNSIALPLNDKFYTHRTVTIDNSGNLYVLGTTYANLSAQTYGHQGQPSLFCFNNVKNTLSEIKSLNLQPTMLRVHLRTDANDNLEIFGKQYKNHVDEAYFENLFYVKLSKEGTQTLINKKIVFDPTKMTNLDKKYYNPAKGLASDYLIRNVIDYPDGEQLFLLENEYYFNAEGNIAINTYSILALKVNKEGNTLFASSIHKQQGDYFGRGIRINSEVKASSNENLSSFSYIKKGDNVYFFYLDDSKNTGDIMKEMKFSKMSNLDKISCYMVKMDSKGEMTKSTLFTLSSLGFVPMFGNAFRSNSSGVLFNAYDIRKYDVMNTKIGLMELE